MYTVKDFSIASLQDQLIKLDFKTTYLERKLATCHH